MDEDIVAKREAVVVEEDGQSHIFIGNLHIALVEDDDNPGPLGWKDGQDPGVIFWKNDIAKIEGDTFEHSTERPILHKKINATDVQRIRDTIL